MPPPSPQDAFRWVLAEPLVADGATEQLQRIRFLSQKNLADLLASPSPEEAAAAAATALRTAQPPLQPSPSAGEGAAAAGTAHSHEAWERDVHHRAEEAADGAQRRREEALRLYLAATGAPVLVPHGCSAGAGRAPSSVSARAPLPALPA